jgi:hypothetical protein
MFDENGKYIEAADESEEKEMTTEEAEIEAVESAAEVAEPVFTDEYIDIDEKPKKKKN